MRAEGVEAIVEAETLAIIGVPEIARALPFFWRTFRRLKRAADERQPDVVVLVDFPEFNLRLAKALKKRGHRVVYYISPQIWAWRSGRFRIIKDHVEKLLTILPFEHAWYGERGVTNVEYVGSPLVNEVKPTGPKEAFCERHGLDAGNPVIALLPGSRRKEIESIFPVMAEAAHQLRQRSPNVHFVVAVAAERDREIVSQILDGRECDSKITIVVGETYDAVSAADAAAVTSGTATLETGIIGTPMTVVYKASRLNYALLRPLIKVPHFGLINLIAGERIVKELIQDDLNGSSLSAELSRLLEPEVNAEIRAKLLEATSSLGGGGASARAAQAIVALIKNKGA
ncbi:MAG: lipid-A-disaccharide synthase [Blastocatellia bacterium]|nr:lipid-A-disaccharide synthase [Blastocatellia bacterium]